MKGGNVRSTFNSIIKISDIESKHAIGEPKKEWLIFMNISFSKGTGELKIEMPDVPG